MTNKSKDSIKVESLIHFLLPMSEPPITLCGKLEGNVVYGDVTETGLPDDKQENPPEEISIKGAKYKLVKE